MTAATLDHAPAAGAAALRSGKGAGDENFPVASVLLKPEHRAPILAFYRFARTGDDVSDHPTLPPHEKLAHLATMRATLAGDSDADPESLALRQVLEAKGLTAQHGLDLLEAFRRDVTKLRYDSWDDLIDYCAVSAMPVGRFVLDVHGEDPARTWPASDALCAALQVINHLQDCGKDRASLDRVYLPQDLMTAAGVGVEALDAPAASPALKGVIDDLARRTLGLLDQSRPFASLIRDRRLAYEVAVIQRLAEDLTARLLARDPLSERVHHQPWEALGLAALAGLDRMRGAAVTGLEVVETPPEPTAQSRASGSSFYAGMKALPKPEREAMYAVYAFCRAVDDVADDQGSTPADRRTQLDAWRRDLHALYTGGPPGLAASLAPHVRTFDLELDDFLAVVDGMQMDVDADIKAPPLEVLDLYCDRVASAVGRLSVRIFGMEREVGRELAHHLGRALQLTNILRDLDEDAEIGRLYLPRELLDAAGIEDDDPWSVVDDPAVDEAARALCRRAQDHYARAHAILAAKPAGKLVAPRLMEAVYSRILARTAARGWAPPRKRVSIGKPELMWLALTRGLLG